MNCFRAIAWVSLLTCCAVHAQSLRADSALSGAPNGAPKASVLKSGTAIKILRREGFWLEIDAGGKTGWVKASAVMLGSGGGATAIDSGRLGTGNIVATSVARGLSAKDLISGKPDFDQATKLEGLSVDATAVASFVNQGQLLAPSEKVSLLVTKTPVTTGNPPSSTNNTKGGQDDW